MLKKFADEQILAKAFVGRKKRPAKKRKCLNINIVTRKPANPQTRKPALAGFAGANARIKLLN